MNEQTNKGKVSMQCKHAKKSNQIYQYMIVLVEYSENPADKNSLNLLAGLSWIPNSLVGLA